MANDMPIVPSEAAVEIVKRNGFLFGLGIMAMTGPPLLLGISLNMFFWVPAVAGLMCVFVGLRRLPVNRQKAVNRVGVLICFFASVTPVLLTSYANRSGAAIRVVIPLGYQGEIALVKNHNSGKEVKIENGVWLLEIPANGTLVVKDDWPLYLWHKEEFVYADGSEAKVESLGTEVGSIQTSTHSWSGSAIFDGATTKWKVLGK